MLNSPPINILSFKLFKVLKAVKNLKKNYILIYFAFQKCKYVNLKSTKIIYFYNFFRKKELRLCQKLSISNPYIFTIQWRRPQTCKNTNSFRSTDLSLQFLRSTLLGCKDMGMRKLKLVERTQFFNETVKTPLECRGSDSNYKKLEIRGASRPSFQAIYRYI